MTFLTFYGGIGEIGGNKILLEDKDTKIFLDFGMNFGEHNKYFTEYMPPRKCTSIRDLQFLGLLPKMKGIYRRDYCEHMGLDTETENSVDGVLLSHAHMDHLGYVHFLRRDIPIHVSEETKAVMDLFTRTGASGFEEFSNFKPTFKLVPKKRGEGMKRRTARDGVKERDVRTFDFGEEFEIGSLKIVPYRVDHSLPGATGYIIFTSEGPLVYTGDLRFHGRHSEWSYNFVEEAKKVDPVAVISEGTRIKEEEAKTEEYVQRESTKHIKGRDGLAIANFPIRDTERLLTFYKTAVKNNRKLIIEYRQAMLLDLMEEHGVERLPSCDNENIRIFYPKKSWGLIGREDFPEEQIERDYRSWERNYVDQDNVIDAEEIRENQGKFLMFMNYFQLNNLIDLRPNQNSVHIRSICEPFNEEMELDQKRINNWLRKFNLYPEHRIHSSGHSSGTDIFEMLREISPKKLFPIHMEYPGKFRKLDVRTKLIEYGKEYEI